MNALLAWSSGGAARERGTSYSSLIPSNKSSIAFYKAFWLHAKQNKKTQSTQSLTIYNWFSIYYSDTKLSDLCALNLCGHCVK